MLFAEIFRDSNELLNEGYLTTKTKDKRIASKASSKLKTAKYATPKLRANNQPTPSNRHLNAMQMQSQILFLYPSTQELQPINFFQSYTLSFYVSLTPEDRMQNRRHQLEETGKQPVPAEHRQFPQAESLPQPKEP
jgi:hypothetical protein